MENKGLQDILKHINGLSSSLDTFKDEIEIPESEKEEFNDDMKEVDKNMRKLKKELAKLKNAGNK